MDVVKSLINVSHDIPAMTVTVCCGAYRLAGASQPG